MDEQAFLDAIECLSPALLQIAFAFSRDAADADAIVRDVWRGTLLSGDPDLRSTALRLVVDKASAAAAGPDSPHPSFEPVNVSGPTVDPSRFRPDGEQWAGHWGTVPPTWPTDIDGEAAMVTAALEALPQAQRVVVSLRDEQGCTADEVCEYLTLLAVEQRALLHRGRAQVRQVVEEYVTRTAAHRESQKTRPLTGVAVAPPAADREPPSSRAG